MRIKKTSLSRN